MRCYSKIVMALLAKVKVVDLWYMTNLIYHCNFLDLLELFTVAPDDGLRW